MTNGAKHPAGLMHLPGHERDGGRKYYRPVAGSEALAGREVLVHYRRNGGTEEHVRCRIVMVLRSIYDPKFFLSVIDQKPRPRNFAFAGVGGITEIDSGRSYASATELAEAWGIPLD